ncbi:MAG: hypothetical protein PVSMB7_07720 [Chloroflexota bacterium]
MVKDIQRQLGDRLRFVFRNFPLTDSHPHALHAAAAAEAAAEQGKFWEMHDVLHAHQDALDRHHLVQYADSVGLDTHEFVRAVENDAHMLRIQSDYRSGEESGVQGTPTFFINGVAYAGGYETEQLLAALESHMKG